MGLKRIKERIKGTFVFEAFSMVRKKPKLLAYIVLLDLLLIGSVFLLNFLSSFILGKEPMIMLNILKTRGAVTAFVFSFIFVYSLLIAFIYSLFKYIILHNIAAFFKNAKLDFNRLTKFYLFNYAAAASAFLLFIILSMAILFIFKKEFAKIPLFLAFLAFLFLFYSFISIAHSLFALEFSFKKLIRKSLGLLFRSPSYIGIYFFDLAILVLYFVSYYLIGLLITSIAKVSPYKYNFVFSFISLAVFYLIIATNRIYFYVIVKRKTEKKS